MRIAIISTPAVAVPPRGYGGTELVVAELAEGLADAGHDVRVFATGDSSVRVRRRALFDTAVWPPSPSHEMAHAAWALQELRREPVDVVHTHTAAALLGGDRADAPVVHTVHHGPDAGLDALYGVCREGCTFVAISEDQRRRLPHAHVVHHGLSADRYAEGAGDGGYAAFLGRYAEEKGAHDAIDAARAAGVPIRLGGRCHPPDEAYAAAALRPRLLLPGVADLGMVDHPAKCALLGGAVATLFPIAWDEPFGLVMIESMFCGTPVIAFARGSVPEVIDEGITGWVVRDAAAMAARLAWLARGGAFDRARCRAHATARFGRRRMVDAYVHVYRRALSGRARAEAC